jgi:hypothetical protein
LPHAAPAPSAIMSVVAAAICVPIVSIIAAAIIAPVATAIVSAIGIAAMVPAPVTIMSGMMVPCAWAMPVEVLAVPARLSRGGRRYRGEAAGGEHHCDGGYQLYHTVDPDPCFR